ncbi:MAG: flagellar basal body rod protein FlgC [Pirellulales bacterium]|nr:flagellar basal body rod protein FlgC [Planctomycetales bacterium]
MFSSFDISTSALVAQRVRLNTISQNIANISTVYDAAGERKPYQPRYVEFQVDTHIQGAGGANGVKVQSVRIDDVAPRLKYEPGNPDANADGYVAYPNIDLTTQFVDALEASRAYEANVGVMDINKDLVKQTLTILA